MPIPVYDAIAGNEIGPFQLDFTHTWAAFKSALRFHIPGPYSHIAFVQPMESQFDEFGSVLEDMRRLGVSDVHIVKVGFSAERRNLQA